MGTIRNKQRLIHLYRFLLRYTDEEHQVTTNDLVQFLKEEDANASRKTVKDDIEVLMGEGIDIVTTKSYFNSYFVGSRLFELPEVTLLVDGIAANVSLSTEKKKKLIDKLLSHLSIYQEEKVRKHLYFAPDHRVSSEQFYYSIDQAREAIQENRKIEFQYLDFAPNGDQILRENGSIYVITPTAVTCSNNRYYVFGYDEERAAMVSLRLDWMVRTRLLAERGAEIPEDLETGEYLNSLFAMNVGEMTSVILECDNDMMGVIQDRFGSSADIWKSTQERFYVKARISISPAFYGWVFQYCGKIQIISPAWVLTGYLEQAKDVIRKERNKELKKRV